MSGARITPAALDALDKTAAVSTLTSRFSWLKSHRAKLDVVIEWQSSIEPRPNFYFRWHLPRLFTSMDILRPHIGQGTSILDISAYVPFSVVMQRQMPALWDRTTYEGGIEILQSAEGQISVSSVSLKCEDELWNLPSSSYDIAIFSEVIEHLPNHPQQSLGQINRLLKPGGLLLVTTPNVTSWKKARLLSDHNWSYDSPTYDGAWGHRYEFSYDQLDAALKASGFQPVSRVTRDVYFDDPQGFAPWMEMGFLAFGKICSGRLKRATKFWQRRGSGLFFLYRKASEPASEQVAI